MKIFKIIHYIFIISIATVALLLIVSIFPITGNYKILVVKSGSMEPSIKMGGVVLIKPISEYQIGDVITFKTSESLDQSITHRIFDIKNTGSGVTYITKGDANNVPDRRGVLPREIIGKVLFDVPYFGFAVDTAKKPLGFMFLIIIPALIIIFDELKKIIQEIVRIRKKKNKARPKVSFDIVKKTGSNKITIFLFILIIFNTGLISLKTTTSYFSDREGLAINTIEIGVWEDENIAPEVTVIYPNGGEVWKILPQGAPPLLCEYLGMNSQCQYPIRWIAQDVDSDDSTLKIDIWFCNQSGDNCFYQIADDIGNTGEHWWGIPYEARFIGVDIRMKVIVEDLDYLKDEDMSDTDFCPPLLTEEDMMAMLELMEAGEEISNYQSEEVNIIDKVDIINEVDEEIIKDDFDIFSENQEDIVLEEDVIDEIVFEEIIIEKSFDEEIIFEEEQLEEIIEQEDVPEEDVNQVNIPEEIPEAKEENLIQPGLIINKKGDNDIPENEGDGDGDGNDNDEPDEEEYSFIQTFDSAQSGVK